MTQSIDLSSEIPNFHNLALFICHLFIDGHFRTGHILYDPNVFEHRLISEIDSVCSHSIPWLTINITEDSPLLWNPKEQTDNILQLIFFNPNYLQREVDEHKHLLTFYRLFVLFSVDETNVKKQITEMRKSELSLSSSSLILHYISETTSVCIHWTPYNGQSNEATDNFEKDYDENMEPIYVANRDNFTGEHLFDLTFGKYDQMWLITIDVTVRFMCKHNSEPQKKIWNGDPVLANLFLSQLKKSFVDITSIDCKKATHQLAQPKFKRFFKEFVKEFVPINDKDVKILKIQRPNTLTIRLYLTFPPKSYHKFHKKNLYPYHLKELTVLYIYARDERRQRRTAFVECLGLAGIWIYLSWMFLAAVLCVMRRRARLRRDGFISSALDTFISFFGGGKLRMHHKLERIFFGILLIATFFLTSIWSDAYLFQCSLSRDQEIDTFDKLTELNPEIYIAISLILGAEQIVKMLKDKMGKNINYVACVHFFELIDKQDASFAYVLDSELVDNIIFIAEGIRNIDVIQEKLGIVNTDFYFDSEQYIPERKMAEIDKVSGSIMENGLRQFYLSQYMYHMQLQAKGKENVEQQNKDFQPVTMEQMTIPLLIVLGCSGAAFFAFVVEILIFRFMRRRIIKLKNRRSNRVMNRQN